MDDIKSLSHSRWRCKYHIVFAPKYRRQAIYGEIKRDIGKILRKLCRLSFVFLSESQRKEVFFEASLDFSRGTALAMYNNSLEFCGTGK